MLMMMMTLMTKMVKSARMSSELSYADIWSLIVKLMTTMTVMMMAMMTVMMMVMMTVMKIETESRQIEFEYSEMLIVICSIENICFTNLLIKKKKKKKKKS